MKKWISVMLLLVLMLGCTSAVAAKKQAVIPDFCNPILERWGATNEKELQQAILTYWEENNPKEWPSIHKNVKTPVSFQFGGTTKELIATHNDWDVAIVSSKNVDLQKLADAGCLVRREGHPLERYALHQWLLPEAVQNMLPKHPLYYYAVYCYSYNATNNEALLLSATPKGEKTGVMILGRSCFCRNEAPRRCGKSKGSAELSIGQHLKCQSYPIQRMN